MRAGVLTVSDRSSRGEREDLGGPALRRYLEGKNVRTVLQGIVPDDAPAISAKLREWTEGKAVDLILTTGGTGVSPRDVTPEATLSVLEIPIPGFGEKMRMESLKITPHAILSRGVAGVRNGILILNLPGSPKGAVENLDAVWDAIPHAVGKIRGDPSDCAPG